MRTSFSWRLRGSACRNSANSPCGSTTHVQKSPNGSPSSSSTGLVDAAAPSASGSVSSSAAPVPAGSTQPLQPRLAHRHRPGAAARRSSRATT